MNDKIHVTGDGIAAYMNGVFKAEDQEIICSDGKIRTLSKLQPDYQELNLEGPKFRIMIPEDQLKIYNGLVKYDFPKVLSHLKSNEQAMITREGWNGKNMWLALNDGRRNAIGFKMREDGILDEVLEVSPFIVMKTADNKLVPWLASQTDILAEDWIILK